MLLSTWVSIWRPQQFTFFLQKFSASFLKYLIFSPDKSMNFSINLLSIAQMWGQTLFIVTLTEDLHNLIKIEEMVIVSPTTPFFSSYSTRSRSAQRPETVEMALPKQMGHENSASFQQTQDSEMWVSQCSQRELPALSCLEFSCKVPVFSQLKSGSWWRASLNRVKGAMVGCAVTPTAGQTQPQSFRDFHLKKVGQWSFGPQPAVQTG